MSTDAADEGPTFRIQKAAELSGVPVELIRAWERRYGVLQPARTAAGYRVYREADVALLRRLRELVDGGTAIGEAARLVPRLREELARAARAHPLLAGPPGPAPTPGLRPAPAHAAGAAGGPGGAAPAPEVWRAALLDAAASLDQPAVSAVLDAALAAASLPAVLEGVVMPALREAGDRWHAGRFSVAQEHLLSQAVRGRLQALLQVAGPAEGLQVRHAVLACFPEETHELGLLGAAVRLRHAGWRVTLLGARLPLPELAPALRQLAPDLVGLSCVVDPGAALASQVLAAARQGAGPRAALWLGGAGAQSHAEACAPVGARLFRGPGDWPQLLA